MIVGGIEGVRPHGDDIVHAGGGEQRENKMIVFITRPMKSAAAGGGAVKRFYLCRSSCLMVFR